MAPAPRTYTRVVATAAAQAALSGLWIASRELSPVQRRLVRLGAVSTVAAAGFVSASRKADSEPDPGDPALDSGDPTSESGDLTLEPAESDTPPADFDRRKAAALGIGVVAGTAGILGRRRMEKLWLARLTRSGHTHPHRALAVRMSAVEFTLHLGLQLADRYKERSRR